MDKFKQVTIKQKQYKKLATRSFSWRWLLFFLPLLLLVSLLLLPWLSKSKPGLSNESIVAPLASTQERGEQPPLYAQGQVLAVAQGTCPVYGSQDNEAICQSSLLFGEQVELIASSARAERLHCRLADGREAYLPSAALTADLTVFDPARYEKKALVLAANKRIMSHSINGSLLMLAPMGSFLYVDLVGQELLRIRLPEGQEGWVNREGLRLFDSAESIPLAKDAARSFASSAMNFFGSRYLPGGLSRDGADMAGIIYIAARVTGLELGRELSKQAAAGEEVKPVLAVEDGLANLAELAPGDVVFFYDNLKDKRIKHAAIMLEKGQALCRITNDSTIVIRDLQEESGLKNRIATIRRYFAISP